MNAPIDEGFAIRFRVFVVQRLQQRAAWNQIGEINDAGNTAKRRGAGTGVVVVYAHGTHEHVVQMNVSVDCAR